MKLSRIVPSRSQLCPCYPGRGAVSGMWASVSDVLFPLPTGRAPQGAGPPCAGDLVPLAAAATGAAPAPTPPDKESPGALRPVTSTPFATVLCHFSSQRRVGREKIPHSGQASKAATEMFPLRARFQRSVRGLGLCCKKALPISWLESSHISNS